MLAFVTALALAAALVTLAYRRASAAWRRAERQLWDEPDSR